jgi:hypothetical protein
MRRISQTNSTPTTVTDLAGLLRHIGLDDIVDLGDEIRTRCPNSYLRDPKNGKPRHEERHPRHWSINKRSLRHFCFSCRYGGGIHQLVMDMTGEDPWNASRTIRKYGLSIESLTTVEHEVFERPKAISEGDLRWFPLPPDRAIKHRKLDLDSLRRYGIRWNPETEGWIFPIRSPAGVLWGWQEKSSDQVLNFPPRIKKSKTLFGLDVILREFLPGHRPPLVLVESPLDVAYIHLIHHSAQPISSFGALVSDDQMHLIVEHTDTLFLALDNDDAGIREIQRLKKERWHRQIKMRIINYRGIPGKDPGEMTPVQFNQACDHSTEAVFWFPK